MEPLTENTSYQQTQHRNELRDAFEQAVQAYEINRVVLGLSQQPVDPRIYTNAIRHLRKTGLNWLSFEQSITRTEPQGAETRAKTRQEAYLRFKKQPHKYQNWARFHSLARQEMDALLCQAHLRQPNQQTQEQESLGGNLRTAKQPSLIQPFTNTLQPLPSIVSSQCDNLIILDADQTKSQIYASDCFAVVRTSTWPEDVINTTNFSIGFEAGGVQTFSITEGYSRGEISAAAAKDAATLLTKACQHFLSKNSSEFLPLPAFFRQAHYTLVETQKTNIGKTHAITAISGAILPIGNPSDKGPTCVLQLLDVGAMELLIIRPTDSGPPWVVHPKLHNQRNREYLGIVTKKTDRGRKEQLPNGKAQHLGFLLNRRDIVLIATEGLHGLLPKKQFVENFYQLIADVKYLTPEAICRAITNLEPTWQAHITLFASQIP